MSDYSNQKSIFSVDQSGKVTQLTYQFSPQTPFQQQSQQMRQQYQDVYGQSVAEISTKGTQQTQRASAMNLMCNSKYGNKPVEVFFQGAKHFKSTGSANDILKLNSGFQAKKEIKKYDHHINDLDKFSIDGHDFPKDPASLFYNWTYAKTLAQPQNKDILKMVQNNQAFSDSFYNPKNPNCQAEACAVVKGLTIQNKLDHALKNPQNFLHDVYESGLLKKYAKQNQKTNDGPDL